MEMLVFFHSFSPWKNALRWGYTLRIFFWPWSQGAYACQQGIFCKIAAGTNWGCWDRGHSNQRQAEPLSTTGSPKMSPSCSTATLQKMPSVFRRPSRNVSPVVKREREPLYLCRHQPFPFATAVGIPKRGRAMKLHALLKTCSTHKSEG